MQPIQDLAIVLKSVSYEERHKIVTALTENHGLVSAIARNSIQSRRFGGGLDLFAASHWIFTLRPGAELYSLTQTNLRHYFKELTTDFEKLALASVFNELIMKIAPQNQACPELFRLHSNALAALSDPPSQEPEEREKEGERKLRFILILLNTYLGKLLQWNGNQPRLQECLECQTLLETFSPQEQLSTVISDAGWICPSCRKESTRHVENREQGVFRHSIQHSMLRLTPLGIQDLQRSLSTPIRQVSACMQASLQEHRELFRFLEGMIVYHIPGFDYTPLGQKPLKALRFLGLESTLQPDPMNLQ